MSVIYKKKISKSDIPSEFEEGTQHTISRIEGIHSVVGVLYIRNGIVQMYTVPETMAQVLSVKLPQMTSLMHRALTEISTVHKKTIIPYTMKIVTNLLKDYRDEWLVRMCSTINTVNPIIDRIMEDKSVEGVAMTNKEGAPIITNMTVIGATNYGLALNTFGIMVQNYIKELDPLDQVLIMRLNTKHMEVIVAPDPEFNIIVIQHGRHKVKLKENEN